MKVCLVGPEMVPFAKTGGLGDVVGALPKALGRLGHEVAVGINVEITLRPIGKRIQLFHRQG